MRPFDRACFLRTEHPPYEAETKRRERQGRGEVAILHNSATSQRGGNGGGPLRRKPRLACRTRHNCESPPEPISYSDCSVGCTKTSASCDPSKSIRVMT